MAETYEFCTAARSAVTCARPASTWTLRGVPRWSRTSCSFTWASTCRFTSAFICSLMRTLPTGIAQWLTNEGGTGRRIHSLHLLQGLRPEFSFYGLFNIGHDVGALSIVHFDVGLKGFDLVMAVLLSRACAPDMLE